MGAITVKYFQGDAKLPGAPKDAELLRDQLLVTYPEASIRIGFITPVLGTHGGTGAVSINIAPLEK